ncbi:MAG TPA: RluA family pseudouridine synthase [Ignavibacteriaceae bacterium]|nr:RluA family pseudouridine synthase [Ignavibacteriaceae bacterium]
MTNLIKEKKYLFELSPTQKKKRLDLYLANCIENATRSKIQKLIDEKLILVNGKTPKASYKVQPSDVIEVTIPVNPHPAEAEPEDIPLEVIYEDEYLMVVNKPAGIVVHPSYANWTGTLVNALLHHSKNLSSFNDPGRPGIVHRIDKDTSGLLVIAKDNVTHHKLSQQFSAHSIEREYWTIAWGKFKEKKGSIELNITRSKSDRKKFTHSKTEGKTAITFYEVKEEFEFASLLKLNLKTGRTHQIRVHLAALGHPVFGDVTYGGRSISSGFNLPKIKSRIENLLEIMTRQALHAKTLGFIHPQTEEFMRFESQLPDDMELLLEKLRK